MKITIVKDYAAASETAGKLMSDFVKANPSCNLCLPTGSTPEGPFEVLVRNAKAENISFANVKGFNMDEYAGLGRDDPNGYYYFVKQRIYDHLNIPPENTDAPEADAADLQAACDAYTKRVAAAGGFDFTLLGIGTDGHIAFNMPADVFHLNTHLEDLSEETIEANARFFDDPDQVPKQAITSGVGMLFSSKVIVLVACGKSKAKIMAEWLNNPVMDPHLPASILHLHPNCTVIMDEEAASEVTVK